MINPNLDINNWLKTTSRALDKAGIGTARLDALVLLEDVLGKNRSWLLAHTEQVLTKTQLNRLDGFIQRRLLHEPLAYIRQKTEFYGRDFYIDQYVLVPRPESETMIDILKKMQPPEPLSIIDVGTGSGALAITAKLELPYADLLATDIDERCLEVARQNARNYKVSIRFLQGNLLQPLPIHELIPKNSLLLCNLPYVPNSHQLNRAAMNEPRHAIFGGTDGLNIYRELFSQFTKLSFNPKYILTEALPVQHNALQKIASDAGFQIILNDDFIQLFELN